MISHTIFKTSLLFYILNGISGRELNEIGSSVGQPKNVRDESNIINFFQMNFWYHDFFSYFSEVFSLFTIVSFPNE